jgi:hypothetical protein
MSDNVSKRLNFETYLQLLKNSIGTGMFRSYYVQDDTRGRFDALDDGSNSCAFYVSGVLVLFGKLAKVHGTIASTIKDLETSGWGLADQPMAGDVLVWEAMDFPDGRREHIGFCVADNRALSTSSEKKVVTEHDIHFGEDNRRIEKIYRMKNWDNAV